MVVLIYALCTLTSVLCAILLLRSYFNSRYRLLLWSGLCFIGLSLNNVLVIADKLVFPEMDLSSLRLFAGLVALLPLLYGLIYEQ